MKNSITCLIFVLVASLSTSVFAQQNNPQQELYSASEKVAYQVTEQMDLDEDEVLYLTRAIYSFEMTMYKVNLSQEAGASSEDIKNYTDNAKEQLNMYIRDMFSEKSGKILAYLNENLDHLK